MDKAVNVLITGSSGFLGKALLNELFAPGSPIPPGKIRVLDLVNVPDTYADKVEMIKGDVRNPVIVGKAAEGMDVVIHTAAIVDWGVRSDKEVMGVNVGGTNNVISACRKNNVSCMVHTSSLDAVYSGKPLIDIDEDQPYPEKHQTTYCKSKFLSEQAVIEANDDTLSTCVLRPSDIYGECDPYHIGSLIDMAKSGFYIRLGNGKSLCQHVYVGNMAYALLLAAASLIKGKSTIRGETYFITDGKGSNFFTFFDQIVAGAGYRIRPRNLWLPRGLAHFLASISEGFAWMVRPIKKYHPKFSRFAVTYTCTDFTFTSDKAKRDFNYSPKYSTKEALERTIAFYRKEREGESGSKQ